MDLFLLFLLVAVGSLLSRPFTKPKPGGLLFLLVGSIIADRYVPAIGALWRSGSHADMPLDRSRVARGRSLCLFVLVVSFGTPPVRQPADVLDELDDGDVRRAEGWQPLQRVDPVQHPLVIHSARKFVHPIDRRH